MGLHQDAQREREHVAREQARHLARYTALLRQKPRQCYDAAPLAWILGLLVAANLVIACWPVAA